MVSQTMSDQLEQESRRMDERLQILRKMMSAEKARREYVCSVCLQNIHYTVGTVTEVEEDMCMVMGFCMRLIQGVVTS